MKTSVLPPDIKGVALPARGYMGQMKSSQDMPQTIGEHLRKHRLELRMSFSSRFFDTTLHDCR